MKRIILLITLLLTIPVSLFAQKESILVIESYHAEYPWDASYIEGLKDILKDGYDLQYFEMDTKRLPASEYDKRAQMAWEKYLELKPSLVILGDDNALKYLGKKFSVTTTPVVYLGINNNPRYYDMARFDNITGVLERPLMKRSIKYIDDFFEVKKVLILFDSGETSKVVHTEVFSGKERQIFGGIIADIKLIDNFGTWQKSVLEAKNQDYDAIIVGLYHTLVDDAGNHVDANKVLGWTSDNTPVPPFAFWDFTVGKGKAIGGYVLFGKAQGKKAGELALKMLADKNHGRIPPQTADNGQLYFSRSQLEKWGLTITGDMVSKTTFIE
ncbi:ABC-type sugar transport system, ATPase component [Desulfamplus magnetovallimortis]|uniref:ABC-type sugar transport system, ATPase component n=1 Tax=Desulfamplus magnetovallimortis TaxID=1246637 RepID=A0A1W1HCR0_9BACT|nr:ABC transporter substrate binding protein [Desulfamplus magnetovallimortis]SLM30267.1 ABC-type sugar transport system, ATPase component [Desulfamplus magnetovallimortis]